MEKNGEKKKKSPVLFFLAVFLVIVVANIIGHFKSSLANELVFPANNGVLQLSTSGNSLMAVTQDNRIYVWDWRDLTKNYTAATIPFSQAVLLESEAVISVNPVNATNLAVTNLRDEQKSQTIFLGTSNDNAKLCRDRQSRMAVLLLSKKNAGETVSFELLKVDAENFRVHSIWMLSQRAATDELHNLAVSDDGKLIVLVGAKQSGGWIVLVDAAEKQVVWDRDFNEPDSFEGVELTPDGSVIYCKGLDNNVYKIKTDSGEMLGKLSDEDGGFKQTSAVKVSADGRLTATPTVRSVKVWDCGTDEVVFDKGTEHKVSSDVAFSPDGQFLATSDMRQGGVIKIWRMPQ